MVEGLDFIVKHKSIPKSIIALARKGSVAILFYMDDKKHKMQTYSLQDIHLTFSSERFKIPK